MKETILIAIGGNALIKDKKHVTVEDQYRTTQQTADHLGKVIAGGYGVIVTHGNGPQVGFILLRSELSRHVLHEVPLVSCVADTQGGIGYHLQQTLYNSLKKQEIHREVATIVTQVVVDPEDPSFSNPSKPIGQFYTKEEALRLAKERGWNVAEDSRRGWRRVVPSPKPLRIIELGPIRRLLEEDVVVVAAGGGGIPVVEQDDGTLRGVDAVIDKDRASALLAWSLGLKTMVISTAVDHVYLGFGTPNQRPIERMTVSEALQYMKRGEFGRGSMLPKIEAAVDFLRHGGNRVIITTNELLEEALQERVGTVIVPD